MNPVTFNNKFALAIGLHPQRPLIETIFGNWKVAPLFDYETTFEKEMQLTPQGTAVGDVVALDWPFELLRLSLTERNVPHCITDLDGRRDTYRTHFVARRFEGQLHMLIFWRDFVTNDKWADTMIHTYTYTKDGKDYGGASIYSPAFGWAKDFDSVFNEETISVMCGSALASFASFLEDAMQPTNRIAEVRPAQEHRSVEWTKARTHYTLITHGHPANTKSLEHGATVASDPNAELFRMAHNRREHKRTLRAARFTYARGKTIKVRATWVGPNEWRSAGGKQIYRILEPVGA
jgi:hypothetical protein